jgi:IclR family acetate operon transcriptional repressor
LTLTAPEADCWDGMPPHSGSAQHLRRYHVQSVDRALTALEHLADADAAGMTLSELARQLEISKSTALSLLRTLMHREFVTLADGGDGPRYRLGLALARLGDKAVGQTGLLDVAMPTLRRLTEETGRTARLGVLDDGYVVVIGRVDGPGFIQVQSHVGRRELPHCSALGKSILALLPEDTVREIASRTGLAARTPHTITTVDVLLEELRVARERGYAVDDEEDSVGVFCVGAALIDHRGTCVGAISVTDVKLTPDTGGIDETGEVVRRHAREVSTLLGASSALEGASLA